ncbi:MULTISPECIES: TIGR04086 family membrane protein [unclassified Romboutsia]|uniref:TIGR04086 family membrane protein n=1 Tax=unclassified Romboutsia TaxID=2626894 RepID=UPI000821428D|nr:MULTISPECIES: TIGR04086 family membrane protein [unclassified Romboutsia]SCI03724.1 putative membrane protein [uncultured Clostridium sp.]
MEKTNHVLKGLGYSYILTLIVLLLYNLVLTFTTVSGNTIAMVTAFITTASAAFGGFYTSQHIKEKGLIYGLIVGLMYIVCLIMIVYLAQENFTFDIDMLYKTVFTTLAGGIGGVLGVNFK